MQPANAPVVLELRVTNRSAAAIREWFDKDMEYRTG